MRSLTLPRHAPSPLCLPACAAEDRFSAAYASRLDRLVEESGAAAWRYGHVHEPLVEGGVIWRLRLVTTRGVWERKGEGRGERVIR